MRSPKAGWRLGLVAAVLCLDPFSVASERRSPAVSLAARGGHLPVVREHSYVVNGKVRPLMFWIGRDNVGSARLTWRAGSDGRRAVELLVGSDPARAPRRINRWGFLTEQVSADRTEILGVMKESGEQTIEEAEERIRRQDHELAVFKAGRTTITGGRAVGGVVTVQAPRDFTYRDVDALLALIPDTPPSLRTVNLPSGAQMGFLSAMESLIRQSVDPCSADRGGARKVPVVQYVYNQTLFDLSLVSCRYQPQLKTTMGAFADVVDGRFHLRNRQTGYDAQFRLFYGAAGPLREVPVRATFRPRWWLEVELVLEPPGAKGT